MIGTLALIGTPTLLIGRGRAAGGSLCRLGLVERNMRHATINMQHATCNMLCCGCSGRLHLMERDTQHAYANSGMHTPTCNMQQHGTVQESLRANMQYATQRIMQPLADVGDLKPRLVRPLEVCCTRRSLADATLGVHARQRSLVQAADEARKVHATRNMLMLRAACCVLRAACSCCMLNCHVSNTWCALDVPAWCVVRGACGMLHSVCGM